jgi:hypothetical protein
LAEVVVFIVVVFVAARREAANVTAGTTLATISDSTAARIQVRWNIMNSFV